jgi:ATP synthase protein I
MVRKQKVLHFTRDKLLQETKVRKESKEDKEGRSKFLTMISLASGLGFSISLPIAGGALLGHFLDRKFGTTPRMTLSLIFLGLMIGVANIYFIMKESEKG